MSDLLRTKLAAMHPKFLAAMPARLAVARELLAREQTRDTTKAVHRLLHELCGNAGKFGCRDIFLELKLALFVAEEVDAEERILSRPETEMLLARLNAVDVTMRPPTGAPRAAS